MKICNKKKYIVGLSGGPDSLFLLDNLIKKVNRAKIIACHVNYNFREDSEKDKNIAIEFCKKNNIAIIVKDIRKDYSNLEKNFEAWAREQRYDFFVEQLEKFNFDKILIAHNMNDDIETYLMQKQKNNLTKYWGIKKETYYKEKKILRPIIEVKKSEILNYLKENSINYAIDSTNFDTKYLRNNIRSKLSENDFEILLKEKKEQNILLKKQYKKIYSILETDLSIKHFNKDFHFNERLLFSFFESKGFGDIFYSRKKNTLKEIIKQLMSSKSFIKIQIESLLLIKDRQYIKFINLQAYKIIDKPIGLLDINEMNYLFLKEDINDFDKKLYITNNWEYHKNDLFYQDKKLNLFYKKQKTSYYFRFYQAIIYDKKNKKIKNSLN
ncbi:tRNA(Ile)-lysidine synthase [Spiroplasma gladiatoris]|uniref:tRNA(Ile)-lysidine synthase n=1 Tax=Spiroplasma gladiatoris TaxID=2143 RepID=A0A4P7AHS7_9MOLU|nr:tRNA lysidine(34) synthetase TilS [Spiroplasma gladiatoris]QBQ07213.1 tRNA(Ile)-lysidine synthase [Spiroplasma gladiatoris]